MLTLPPFLLALRPSRNSQQIDHIFATKALAKTARFEILHVNTWTDAASQASDHDPLLASINVC